MGMRNEESVLIESDWNLKEIAALFKTKSLAVLIESDWNLKWYTSEILFFLQQSINRIRLEFKVAFKFFFLRRHTPY